MAKPIYDAAAVRVDNLVSLIDIPAGGTASKPLVEAHGFRQVLFAMDSDQSMLEHKAPFVITVQVITGRLVFGVGGELHDLAPGDWLLLPANEPHDVSAQEPSRFLLTLVKPE